MDFDIRTEFLIAPFITHFQAYESKMELSRSHSYRKNDPAPLEPKHCRPVRLQSGDDRFEPHDLVERLVEIRFSVLFE